MGERVGSACGNGATFTGMNSLSLITRWFIMVLAIFVAGLSVSADLNLTRQPWQ
jgi:hypothetical protein